MTSNLIRMINPAPAPCGPDAADVHPMQVGEYVAAGWIYADSDSSKDAGDGRNVGELAPAVSAPVKRGRPKKVAP